jgi:hypothetical protein
MPAVPITDGENPVLISTPRIGNQKEITDTNKKILGGREKGRNYRITIADKTLCGAMAVIFHLPLICRISTCTRSRRRST